MTNQCQPNRNIDHMMTVMVMVMPAVMIQMNGLLLDAYHI
jgi:hypothetical protein